MSEKPVVNHEQHARIRRVKFVLKFMPRRAVLHKYPMIGRFAEWTRKRAYLWSLKPEAMRPAFYAGSVLSLLPVMGVQLPLALLLAVLLRANYMVMGGLQFITNPFTAAPIYYATHQLGAQLIEQVGFGHALAPADPQDEVLPVSHFPEDPVIEHQAQTPGAKKPSRFAASARKVGNAINALIVGGVVSGLALGLVIDILYRSFWQHYTLKHPPRPPKTKPPENPPPA